MGQRIYSQHTLKIIVVCLIVLTIISGCSNRSIHVDQVSYISIIIYIPDDIVEFEITDQDEIDRIVSFVNDFNDLEKEETDITPDGSVILVEIHRDKLPDIWFTYGKGSDWYMIFINDKIYFLKECSISDILEKYDDQVWSSLRSEN